MNSYLDLKSTDVRFIGICGMSGMGKSTLAQIVFNRIHDQFDASSFLEISRDDSNDKHGLVTLQERLLFDMCRIDFRLRDASKGVQMNRNILFNKKVLIVVDDVTDTRQLENLLGKLDWDWFGQGSRIIVTTEDKILLASYEIKVANKAEGLNKDEALQLFSLNAFHKPHCENDFLDLCNDFVNHAQGNPLVLKVLGSHLSKRTKKEWESARNQLKAIPDENIQEKLRIAFTGLEADEKNLFLDIACFFKTEEMNRVAHIPESLSYSHIIKNLIHKSLITDVGGEFEDA